MNRPQLYICPFIPELGVPPPSPCPASCIELVLVFYFTHGNVYVSMLFTEIIPPFPSPTELKSLLYMSVFFAALHEESLLPPF